MYTRFRPAATESCYNWPMSAPNVSVIIPAHNEAFLLPRCLTALTHQKENPPFELIVVDNNSSDDTARIAQSFGVKVIRETKPGPAAARNRGIRAASGDILIFVDADCIVAPKHVARVVEWFSRDPRRDAVAGAYFFYDAPLWIRWSAKKIRLYSLYYKIIRRFFGVQILLSGNFAIRKNALAHVGGFNERLSDITTSEDTDLAIRLKKAGVAVHFLPTITVRSSYRRMKNFDARDQVSRLSTHFSYLMRYKRESATG